MTLMAEERITSAEDCCGMRLEAGLSPKSLETTNIGSPNQRFQQQQDPCIEH